MHELEYMYMHSCNVLGDETLSYIQGICTGTVHVFAI